MESSGTPESKIPESCQAHRLHPRHLAAPSPQPPRVLLLTHVVDEETEARRCWIWPTTTCNYPGCKDSELSHTPRFVLFPPPFPHSHRLFSGAPSAQAWSHRQLLRDHLGRGTLSNRPIDASATWVPAAGPAPGKGISEPLNQGPAPSEPVNSF